MRKVVTLPFPLPSNSITGDQILRLPRVEERTGVGKSFIYAAIKAGTFPAPFKLGDRAVGWTASSIDAWIQARVQSSQQEAA